MTSEGVSGYHNTACTIYHFFKLFCVTHPAYRLVKAEDEDLAAIGEDLHSTYHHEVVFACKLLYALRIPQLVVLCDAHTIQPNLLGLLYELRWVDVRTPRAIHRMSMKVDLHIKQRP